MKKLSVLLLSAILVVCVSCTPTTLYKSVTTEKDADGKTKQIEKESVSQVIETSKKLRLEKIRFE